MKNAELVQRSSYKSVLYTEQKWISLMEDIPNNKARTPLMTRPKMYFKWLQVRSYFVTGQPGNYVLSSVVPHFTYPMLYCLFRGISS